MTKERLKKAVSLEVSATHVVACINQYVFGPIRYSLGLVDWGKTGLESLDKKIRKILTKNKFRSSKGGIGHLNLSRSLGGRGLHSLHDQEIISANRLWSIAKLAIPSIIEEFPENKTIQRLKEKAKVGMDLSGKAEPTSKEITRALQKEKLEVIANHMQMQNKFETAIRNQEGINLELSRNFLRKITMNKYYEKILFDLKDQTIPLNQIRAAVHNKNKKNKSPAEAKCRMCGEAEESVEHVLSHCKTLNFTLHKQRHDAVAKEILRKILATHGEKFETKWYREAPKSSIALQGKGLVQYDSKILTPTRVEHCKPDLTLKLPCGQKVIIEIAIPYDTRVTAKSKEKLDRYLPLAEQMSLTSGKPVIILPIVIGTLGAVSNITVESIAKLKKLGVHVNLANLQKAAVIGSARTAQHVLRS